MRWTNVLIETATGHSVAKHISPEHSAPQLNPPQKRFLESGISNQLPSLGLELTAHKSTLAQTGEKQFEQMEMRWVKDVMGLIGQPTSKTPLN